MIGKKKKEEEKKEEGADDIVGDIGGLSAPTTRSQIFRQPNDRRHERGTVKSLAVLIDPDGTRKFRDEYGREMYGLDVPGLPHADHNAVLEGDNICLVLPNGATGRTVLTLVG